ncbi:MAG TPA: hypothetical protein PKL77_00925, partial [Candidatus Omnitrophota bacterium]|nr:hypothetical protein [Candidatus Omnitrophota bacterium]
MIGFRQSRFVKVVALFLAIIFAGEQTCFAEVTDLRKQGTISGGDILMAGIMGYINAQAAVPSGSATTIFARVYAAPWVAKMVVNDVLKIKDPVLSVALETGISMGISTGVGLQGTGATSQQINKIVWAKVVQGVVQGAVQKFVSRVLKGLGQSWADFIGSQVSYWAGNAVESSMMKKMGLRLKETETLKKGKKGSKPQKQSSLSVEVGTKDSDTKRIEALKDSADKEGKLTASQMTEIKTFVAWKATMARLKSEFWQQFKNSLVAGLIQNIFASLGIAEVGIIAQALVQRAMANHSNKKASVDDKTKSANELNAAAAILKESVKNGGELTDQQKALLAMLEATEQTSTLSDAERKTLADLRAQQEKNGRLSEQDVQTVKALEVKEANGAALVILRQINNNQLFGLTSNLTGEQEKRLSALTTKVQGGTVLSVVEQSEFDLLLQVKNNNRELKLTSGQEIELAALEVKERAGSLSGDDKAKLLLLRQVRLLTNNARFEALEAKLIKHGLTGDEQHELSVLRQGKNVSLDYSGQCDRMESFSPLISAKRYQAEGDRRRSNPRYQQLIAEQESLKAQNKSLSPEEKKELRTLQTQIDFCQVSSDMHMQMWQAQIEQAKQPLKSAIVTGVASVILQLVSKQTDSPIQGAYLNMLIATTITGLLIKDKNVFVYKRGEVAKPGSENDIKAAVDLVQPASKGTGKFLAILGALGLGAALSSAGKNEGKAYLGVLPFLVLAGATANDGGLGTFYGSLLGANQTNAVADAYSLGGATAELNNDGTFNLHWGDNPMDSFFVSRYVDYIDRFNEDGFAQAHMDELVSSMHYTATAAMAEVLQNVALHSHSLQKPYVVTAERMKFSEMKQFNKDMAAAAALVDSANKRLNSNEKTTIESVGGGIEGRVFDLVDSTGKVLARGEVQTRIGDDGKEKREIVFSDKSGVLPIDITDGTKTLKQLGVALPTDNERRVTHYDMLRDAWRSMNSGAENILGELFGRSALSSAEERDADNAAFNARAGNPIAQLNLGNGQKVILLDEKGNPVLDSNGQQIIGIVQVTETGRKGPASIQSMGGGGKVTEEPSEKVVQVVFAPESGHGAIMLSDGNKTLKELGLALPVLPTNLTKRAKDGLDAFYKSVGAQLSDADKASLAGSEGKRETYARHMEEHRAATNSGGVQVRVLENTFGRDDFGKGNVVADDLEVQAIRNQAEVDSNAEFDDTVEAEFNRLKDEKLKLISETKERAIANGVTPEEAQKQVKGLEEEYSKLTLEKVRKEMESTVWTPEKKNADINARAQVIASQRQIRYYDVYRNLTGDRVDDYGWTERSKPPEPPKVEPPKPPETKTPEPPKPPETKTPEPPKPTPPGPREPLPPKPPNPPPPGEPVIDIITTQFVVTPVDPTKLDPGPLPPLDQPTPPDRGMPLLDRASPPQTPLPEPRSKSNDTPVPPPPPEQQYPIPPQPKPQVVEPPKINPPEPEKPTPPETKQPKTNPPVTPGSVPVPETRAADLNVSQGTGMYQDRVGGQVIYSVRSSDLLAFVQGWIKGDSSATMPEVYVYQMRNKVTVDPLSGRETTTRERVFLGTTHFSFNENGNQYITGSDGKQVLVHTPLPHMAKALAKFVHGEQISDDTKAEMRANPSSVIAMRSALMAGLNEEQIKQMDQGLAVVYGGTPETYLRDRSKDIVELLLSYKGRGALPFNDGSPASSESNQSLGPQHASFAFALEEWTTVREVLIQHYNQAIDNRTAELETRGIAHAEAEQLATNEVNRDRHALLSLWMNATNDPRSPIKELVDKVFFEEPGLADAIHRTEVTLSYARGINVPEFHTKAMGFGGPVTYGELAAEAARVAVQQENGRTLSARDQNILEQSAQLAGQDVAFRQVLDSQLRMYSEKLRPGAQQRLGLNNLLEAIKTARPTMQAWTAILPSKPESPSPSATGTSVASEIAVHPERLNNEQRKYYQENILTAFGYDAAHPETEQAAWVSYGESIAVKTANLSDNSAVRSATESNSVNDAGKVLQIDPQHLEHMSGRSEQDLNRAGILSPHEAAVALQKGVFEVISAPAAAAGASVIEKIS